jgi:hypothetical protein
MIERNKENAPRKLVKEKTCSAGRSLVAINEQMIVSQNCNLWQLHR